MSMVDTSTPQQRRIVSHQVIDFNDTVIDAAFPLSYRKLVVEGHFHREFEKSIRSKHIRRDVVDIFWPESLLKVTRGIWVQGYCSLNSCDSVSNTIHSPRKWNAVTLSPCKTRCFEYQMTNQWSNGEFIHRPIKWFSVTHSSCKTLVIKEKKGTHIRSFQSLRIPQMVYAYVISVNIWLAASYAVA